MTIPWGYLGFSMENYEYRYLGKRDIPSDLSAFDIDFFFSLSPGDRAAVCTRRGPMNRLGAALQLFVVRMSG